MTLTPGASPGKIDPDLRPLVPPLHMVERGTLKDFLTVAEGEDIVEKATLKDFLTVSRG